MSLISAAQPATILIVDDESTRVFVTNVDKYTVARMRHHGVYPLVRSTLLSTNAHGFSSAMIVAWQLAEL